MKSVKAKETGDNLCDDDIINPRVTSATLIVPKDITRELFHSDGRISDRRLETIQYKCFCQFRLAKLPATNPGSKVCERIVVTYSYPTKNHQVTLRLFNDLVQQCASALRIASLIKVTSVNHRPHPPSRAKSVAALSTKNKATAASASAAAASTGQRPEISGDDIRPAASTVKNADKDT